MAVKTYEPRHEKDVLDHLPLLQVVVVYPDAEKPEPETKIKHFRLFILLICCIVNLMRELVCP